MKDLENFRDLMNKEQNQFVSSIENISENRVQKNLVDQEIKKRLLSEKDDEKLFGLIKQISEDIIMFGSDINLISLDVDIKSEDIFNELIKLKP